MFDADSGAGDSEVISSAKSNSDGTYSLPAISGAVKLQFEPSPAGVGYPGRAVPRYLPQWSGGSTDFEHAAPAEAAAGQTDEVDAVLSDAQIALGDRPTINHTPRVGNRLTVFSGDTSYDNEEAVKRSYRWLRTKGGKTTPIAGANHTYYVPTIKDAGSRLSVRVDHTPPPSSFPGIEPASSTSVLTPIIKSKSHVLATAKAIGGRKFKVTVEVDIAGAGKPDGRVYVVWLRLKQKGNRLYASGKTLSKLVRYRDGKATYTVKVGTKGYWAYGAVHPTTSTIIGDDHFTRFLKVR